MHPHFIDFLWILMKRHQEPLHCHQLEEELDDWCRCWYFQNGMGLSCRSPDSWCRRFNVDNASFKSERLSMVQCFQTYWERDPPILFVMIHISSSRSCSSMALRKSGSFKKRSWIPFFENASWCISFSNYGLDDIPSSVESSHLCGHEVVPS